MLYWPSEVGTMHNEQPFRIDYSCAALWGAIVIAGPLFWALLIWAFL